MASLTILAILIADLVLRQSVLNFPRRFLYMFPKNLSVFQEALYKARKTVVLQDYFHRQFCSFSGEIFECDFVEF